MIEALKQFLINYEPETIYPDDEESDNCARYGQFLLIQAILLKIKELEKLERKP